MCAYVRGEEVESRHDQLNQVNLSRSNFCGVLPGPYIGKSKVDKVPYRRGSGILIENILPRIGFRKMENKKNHMELVPCSF